MAKRNSKPAIKVARRDWVLIGRPGVSMPGDWFLAVVLWSCRAPYQLPHAGNGADEMMKLDGALNAREAA